MKYDAFLEYEHQLQDAKVVVGLGFQSYCAPARATKQYVEELAREHGFHLVRVNLDGRYDAERAGENIPYLAVYHDGVCNTAPLLGAQTKNQIVAFLKERGAIAP